MEYTVATWSISRPRKTRKVKTPSVEEAARTAGREVDAPVFVEVLENGGGNFFTYDPDSDSLQVGVPEAALPEFG